MFKKFTDLMEAVRARLDQEREAAARRHGESPEHLESKRSALRSAWKDRGDEVSPDYQPYESSDDTDTSRPD